LQPKDMNRNPIQLTEHATGVGGQKTKRQNTRESKGGVNNGQSTLNRWELYRPGNNNGKKPTK